MGRVKRIYYNRAVYHVIARGNNRQRILEAAAMKEFFLKSVAKQKQRFEFKVYGYVVMDNHIHMMIGTGPAQNISGIMQRILLSFSLQYRRRHKYVGHVWQGRFKSLIIEGSQYVEECLAYIHQNPVRAGMVRVAEEYGWSSARFYQKLEEYSDLLAIDKYSDGPVLP